MKKDVDKIVRWLVDGAPGAKTSPEVLTRVCVALREAGVPVARAEAFVRTLHPHIVGRRFVWTPDAPVEVLEQSYAYLTSQEFVASPVATVFAKGTWERGSLPGYTDLVAAPLAFLSGQVHAVTFASKEAGGWVSSDVDALHEVVPALARIAEILALSRTAANLLSTYVGRNAGEQILHGKIQRGDVDTIHAVIWFSDLRGFTSMSSQLEPRDLIRVLNDVFECQVPAIESRGGEVLKFIGDGLFAIFPLQDESAAHCSSRVDDALAAAEAAFSALDALNGRRAATGAEALRCGVALHVGDIAYGNIGGASRLDFTCIGRAVNVAARLEGIASKVGERLVVSDEVKKHSTRPMRELGTFELKGVPEKKAAWAP